MSAYFHETDKPAHRIMVDFCGPVAGTIMGKFFQVIFALLLASLWRRWCGIILLLCGLTYTLAAVSNHFLLL